MTTFEKLQRAKSDAWKLYDSWRKNGVDCPAFKSKVQFSLIGWRHIIGATGNKKRTSYSTYRKLMLLPYVKTILEQSRLVQNIDTNSFRTYYALEGMVEVDENNIKEFRKVRVVLIEDKIGNKIFYSVMDKKKKLKMRKK